MGHPGTLRPFPVARAHLPYVLMMTGASALGLVKTLGFAALLGVQEFGLYSLALLTSGYAAYALGLGLKEGILREGGIAYGRGEHETLRQLTGQALVLVLVVGATVGAVVAFCVWRWLPAAQATRDAVALAALLAFALVQFNLVCNDLRIRQELNGFAAALLGRSIAALAFGSWAAISYGFVGVVVAETASVALAFLAVVLSSRTSFQPAMPRPETIAPIIRMGLPLSGNNLLRSLSLNVDRWLVAFALGARALGQYSFALIPLTLGMAIVNLMGQALGPRWINDYGRHGNLALIRRDISKTAKRVAIGLLMAGVLVVLVAPYLILALLPDYRPAAALLPIVYLGVAFYMLNLYDWVAVAAGRGMLLVRISTVVAVLLVAMDLIAVQLAWGLVGFAFAFAIARAVDFLLNWRASRALLSDMAIQTDQAHR